MRKVFVPAGILLVMMSPSVAYSQTAQLTSNQISRTLQLDSGEEMIKDSTTVLFPSTDRGTTFTIDFVVHYPRQRASAPPAVVDIIVTERPVADEHPVMTIQADGETVPVVARPHGQRSVVASVTYGEFMQLASAASLVQHVFDMDLNVGEGSLAMLRGIAADWVAQ